MRPLPRPLTSTSSGGCPLGRRAEDGAERPRLRRRHLHAGYRERLPRRRAGHRRLGPRRDGGPGPGPPRRVLGAQADPSRRAPADHPARDRGEGTSSWCTPRAAAKPCGRSRVAADDRRRAVLGDDEVLDAGALGARHRGPLLAPGRAADADGHRVGEGRAERRALHRPGTARRRCTRNEPGRPSSSGGAWARARSSPRGRSVGSGVASGPVRVVLDPRELAGIPGRRGAGRPDDRSRLGAGAEAGRGGRHR